MFKLEPAIKIVHFSEAPWGSLIRYGDNGIGLKMSIPLGEGNISGAPKLPYVLDLRSFEFVEGGAMERTSPYVLLMANEFYIDVFDGGVITSDMTKASAGDLLLYYNGTVSIVTEGARVAFTRTGERVQLHQHYSYLCKNWAIYSDNKLDSADKRALFTR